LFLRKAADTFPADIEWFETRHRMI
jgi:hypothetical protein